MARPMGKAISPKAESASQPSAAISEEGVKKIFRVLEERGLSKNGEYPNPAIDPTSEITLGSIVLVGNNLVYKYSPPLKEIGAEFGFPPEDKVFNIERGYQRFGIAKEDPVVEQARAQIWTLLRDAATSAQINFSSLCQEQNSSQKLR